MPSAPPAPGEGDDYGGYAVSGGGGVGGPRGIGVRGGGSGVGGGMALADAFSTLELDQVPKTFLCVLCCVFMDVLCNMLNRHEIVSCVSPCWCYIYVHFQV